MIEQLHVDVGHVLARRADLRQHIDIQKQFEEWQESCVPSYCHPNPFASYVSWLRLFRAASLARKYHPELTRILDFGSSVGELGHLFPDEHIIYEFIEQDEKASSYLQSRLPRAVRQNLEAAPEGAYDCLFAIDSLEHNNDFPGLLRQLHRKVRPDGIFIISGPTENWVYRIGRSLARFRGGYHVTNIYDIEAEAARLMRLQEQLMIFPGLPLFRLTAWRPGAESEP